MLNRSIRLYLRLHCWPICRYSWTRSICSCGVDQTYPSTWILISQGRGTFRPFHHVKSNTLNQLVTRWRWTCTHAYIINACRINCEEIRFSNQWMAKCIIYCWNKYHRMSTTIWHLWSSSLLIFTMLGVIIN